MTHMHRQALGWNLPTVDVQHKIIDIVMPEIYGLESMVPRKSVFFTMVKIRRFGMGPNTALSIEIDCSLENVKVLSSTLVKLYLASIPLLRASL